MNDLSSSDAIHFQSKTLSIEYLSNISFVKIPILQRIGLKKQPIKEAHCVETKHVDVIVTTLTTTFMQKSF